MRISPVLLNPFIKTRYLNPIGRYHSLPFDTVEFKSNHIETPQEISEAKIKDNCSEGNFRIKNIKNLRCPACHKLMLSDEQIHEFVNSVCHKKGKNLVKALSKYESDSIFTNAPAQEAQSIYRGQKKQIVDEIKKLALQYPNFTIKDIVQAKGINCLNGLVQEQLKVVDELERYIKIANISELEYEEITYVIKTFKDQIQDLSAERFYRQNFISALQNITTNKTVQKRIDETILKLPKSDNNIDSFFVKYSADEFLEEEIVANLVSNTIPTAEHLIPKSKEGENKLSNYICDCEDCNSRRRDLDFKIWMKQIPNFEKQLQEYIDTVAKNIEDENLDGSYYNYIPNIINTISILSEGQIKLKRPIAKSKELSRREEVYKTIYNKYETLKKQIETTEQEISDIENYEYFSEIIEHRNAFAAKKKTILDNIEALEAEQKTKSLNSIKSLKGSLAATYIKLGKAMQDDEDTETLTKTRLQLEDKIKNYNEEELQKEVDETKAKLAEMKKLLEQIEEEERQSHPRETILIELKEHYSRKLKQINTLIENINQCKIMTIKLSEINRQYDEYVQKNAIIEAENDSILRKTNGNVSDEPYLNYTYLQALLKEANKRIANKKVQKEKSLYELLKISKEAIIKQLNDLEGSPEVIYYLNKEEIEENKKIIEDLKIKINSITEVIKQLEISEMELGNILGGEPMEEIEEKYNEIVKEEAIIEGAKNIEKIKGKLENMKKEFELCRTVLSKIRDYKFMPKNKFNYLTEQVL